MRCSCQYIVMFDSKATHLLNEDLVNGEKYKKIQATNAVKQAFPKAEVVRKGTRSERVTYYKNISHKISQTTFTSESSSALSSRSESSFPDVSDSPEVKNIKKSIADTSSELDSVNKKIDDRISGEKIQNDVVKTLFHMQAALLERIQEWQDCLINLLQKEVNCIVQQNRIAKIFAPTK